MTHGRDHHCVFGRNLNSLSVGYIILFAKKKKKLKSFVDKD